MPSLFFHFPTRQNSPLDHDCMGPGHDADVPCEILSGTRDVSVKEQQIVDIP